MISVLYEDDNVLAVDKPEGLAAIPERFEPRCVLSLLEGERGARLFVVHRLDKAVSGVLLFAKNETAHRDLNKQFEQRTIDKRYAAIVHGIPPPEGEIDAPIRMFGSGRMGVDARGKPSLTRYVIRRSGDRYALLAVSPHTGRRHQIRVHLYHIGHPIVGDTVYGDRTIQQTYPRLMLHAVSITYLDGKGEHRAIVSPVPSSFTLPPGEGTGPDDRNPPFSAADCST